MQTHLGRFLPFNESGQIDLNLFIDGPRTTDMMMIENLTTTIGK